VFNAGRDAHIAPLSLTSGVMVGNPHEEEHHALRSCDWFALVLPPL